jgi:hypothetical protein
MYVDALPDEPADPKRLVIEELRRRDRAESLEKRSNVIGEKKFKN